MIHIANARSRGVFEVDRSAIDQDRKTVLIGQHERRLQKASSDSPSRALARHVMPPASIEVLRHRPAAGD